MNPRPSVARALRLAVLFLISAGCQRTLIAGYEDGGQHATTSTGIAASTTGGAGTAGPFLGSSTSAAGSTGGTTSGTSASTGGGTTSGTTTGDAGPCKPFGTECGSNAECCTDSCDFGCAQAAGQPCLTMSDCSSDVCTDQVCACATSVYPSQQALCATDADCCNGVACHLRSEDNLQYGACCNPLGGACLDPLDCCDHNCVNGQCACLKPGTGGGGILDCQSDDDCCTGKCLQSACLNGPGQPCTYGGECSTRSCVDGGCNSCGAVNALCATASDCCSGLACPDLLAVLNPDNFPRPGPVTDAGHSCCLANGSPCDSDAGADRADLQGCCGTCVDFACTCVGPGGGGCDNDQACCAGEACLLDIGGSVLACCQQDGQLCFSGPECCTGSCVNQECACLASGAECSDKFGFTTPEGAGSCCSGTCGDAGTCE